MRAMPLTSRAMEWARRYLPAELLGTAATLLGAGAALVVWQSAAAGAVAGTWAEGLVFYGVIVARDLQARGRPSPSAALAALRDLLLEFGPAELLDCTIIRPTALYAGLALAPSPAIGLLVGKLVADMVFYLPTIASYELMRRGRA
jgi:hypothetical protein